MSWRESSRSGTYRSDITDFPGGHGGRRTAVIIAALRLRQPLAGSPDGENGRVLQDGGVFGHFQSRREDGFLGQIDVAPELLSQTFCG